MDPVFGEKTKSGALGLTEDAWHQNYDNNKVPMVKSTCNIGSSIKNKKNPGGIGSTKIGSICMKKTYIFVYAYPCLENQLNNWW